MKEGTAFKGQRAAMIADVYYYDYGTIVDILHSGGMECAMILIDEESRHYSGQTICIPVVKLRTEEEAKSWEAYAQTQKEKGE